MGIFVTSFWGYSVMNSSYIAYQQPVSIARKENDYATENMLQWFVSEQVEEEETAQGMIDSLKELVETALVSTPWTRSLHKEHTSN